MNTPETHHPTKGARSRVGAEAAEANRQLVRGQVGPA